MICLSWNCLGADNPYCVRNVNYMVRTNSVDIIILLETHILDIVADERVEAIGRSGGISILWDESYNSVTIMSKQDHFIRFKAIKGNVSSGSFSFTPGMCLPVCIVDATQPISNDNQMLDINGDEILAIAANAN
ncbi:hypothetical protein V2J09_003735 [Rumex salicifolius]